MKFICPRCKEIGFIRYSPIIDTVVCINGHIWRLDDISKTERMELLKSGFTVKCKICDNSLKRIDDIYDGFCSEKCKQEYQGIKSLPIKELLHICFWYYLQRKNEYENRKNKRSGRTLGKLIKKLDVCFK